jgi:hypothetical protein
VLELRDDPVEEVGVLVRCEAAAAVQVQRRRFGRLRARRTDVSELRQLRQYFVAALDRGQRVLQRVVFGGSLRQAGEQRGLVERELRSWLVEVQLGGGLHAQRLLPVHGSVRRVVEVGREDRLLGHVLREPLGDHRLLHLSLEALLMAEVEEVGELHRDRRGALHGLARHEVGDRGADDRRQVDRAGLVEALVLDRDDRFLHDRRDLRGGDRYSHGVGGDDPELLAVCGVDDRARHLLDRLQLVERGSPVRH